MNIKAFISLDDIDRIEIYCNTKKKYKNKIVEETGCDYAINAAFFSRYYKPLQTLRVGGKTIAKDALYNYFGYGWDTVENFGLTNEFTKYDNFICCMAGAIDKKPVKMYYNKDVSGSRPRSAIGKTDTGIMLYCDKAGKTPEQVRDIMLSAGCNSVVVFDGGGSTQGYFNGVQVTSSENRGNGRVCYSYILIYLKKNKNKPSTPAYKNPHQIPTSTMRRGSRSNGVKWLQCALNHIGYNCGTVDGVFGYGTRNSVIAFQQRYKLVADGIVGASTREKIIEVGG